MASRAAISSFFTLASFLGDLTIAEVFAVTTVVVSTLGYTVRTQSDTSSSSSDGSAKASIASTSTHLATFQGPRFLLLLVCHI
jgi:hypothetical protein